MRRYAIVNYNMYCNFTNYGSALHTYALNSVINTMDPNNIQSIVLDYCPDVLLDKDPLNPFKNLWDKDAETIKMCELSMPDIRINYTKFQDFYKRHYNISEKKYTSVNFNDSLKDEKLFGYICGSDTIWCVKEFEGFDDGYFGNYPSMKSSHTISYAASFGDGVLNGKDLITLKERMQNFKAISVRENTNIDFIRQNVHVPVSRVLDPTLLLTGSDYDIITTDRLLDEPYVLLYARRYNKRMEEYADELAQELGCKIIEISLRAVNSNRHIMMYSAGIEEFLSLTKYAKYVVTNSFHGAIFATQMHTPFKVFSREQADTKIDDLLDLLDLKCCKMVTEFENTSNKIDFFRVEDILEDKRKESLKFLREALELNE